MNELIKSVSENDFLVMLFSLGGAGMLTFWLKNMPLQIYNLIKRQITTTVVITSHHIVFYDLLQWIEKEYKHVNFRNLKVNNGKYGENIESNISIGYGWHIIKYKNKRILITLNKEPANQSEKDKESISITYFGRKKDILYNIVKGITKDKNISDLVLVYKFGHNYWEPIPKIPKRNWNSIFIKDKDEKNIQKTITDFISKEEWYKTKGIPYQLGILLYGPPGTGKTSIIKAIASYIDYKIHYLSPTNMIKLEEAVTNLPNNSILVIEDIDSASYTKQRQKDNSSDELLSNIRDDMSQVSLSDILNTLDGIGASHGRILVATTNHIDKLDTALIRPGRIDLKVEIGYVDSEILNKFTKCFFDTEVKLTQPIKDNITVAELQGLVLSGKTLDEILEWCKK